MTYAWLAKADPGRENRMRQVEALMRRMGRQISSAFWQSLRTLAAEVDIDEIVRLLQQGRVSQAIDQVNARMAIRGWSGLAREVSYEAIFAAREEAAEADAQLDLARVAVTFDPTETEVVDYLRANEMTLIREMSRETVASVRTSITQGVQDGRNPLDVARDIRRHIGLTQRQTRAVLNFRRMLEQGDREALQRALRDRRFDPTVLRAIRDGKPLSKARIDAMVKRYEERYLRYRSETIARTEALRAANGGADMAWRQAVREGKVPVEAITRRWLNSGDHKVRDSHKAIPTLNAEGVGLNEAFKSPLGPIMFPGDPSAPPENSINCRCTVLYNVDVVMVDRMQRRAA